MGLFEFLATWEDGLYLPDPASLSEAATALATHLEDEARVKILLSGPMGAGKTTFVQALARYWKIAETVTSPTYALLNVYEGPDRKLLHLDACRLSRNDDLSILMLEELLSEPWCLAVEWPENVVGLPKAKTVSLRLENAPEGREGRLIFWTGQS